MAADSEEPGFLSRWSRRKAQVREGSATASSMGAAEQLQHHEPALMPLQDAPVAVTAAVPKNPVATEFKPAPATNADPLPTLADVASLTRDSDYSRFVVGSVQPDVKNAALAKLFTDPHFNVMDGLDVYIDDYGKPDPLPPGMLRQMFQSQVLGLFDDEEDDDNDTKKPNSDAGLAPPPTAAMPDAQQTAEPPAELTAEPTAAPLLDENTNLQLQPDDGAGRRGLEPGTVKNAGRTY